MPPFSPHSDVQFVPAGPIQVVVGSLADSAEAVELMVVEEVEIRGAETTARRIWRLSREGRWADEYPAFPVTLLAEVFGLNMASTAQLIGFAGRYGFLTGGRRVARIRHPEKGWIPVVGLVGEELTFWRSEFGKVKQALGRPWERHERGSVLRAALGETQGRIDDLFRADMILRAWTFDLHVVPRSLLGAIWLDTLDFGRRQLPLAFCSNCSAGIETHSKTIKTCGTTCRVGRHRKLAKLQEQPKSPPERRGGEKNTSEDARVREVKTLESQGYTAAQIAGSLALEVAQVKAILRSKKA
ncbi:MAG: hypothetical protein JWO38_7687 [Gemmataceae bacterium]|nr:hypothetical protein [Gemmataceae bacterium]